MIAWYIRMIFRMIGTDDFYAKTMKNIQSVPRRLSKFCAWNIEAFCVNLNWKQLKISLELRITDNYPSLQLSIECYFINLFYVIYSKYEKPKINLLLSMWCDFYDKFMIWHVQNRSSVQYQRQFQLDRFLLKLFGKPISGMKRSISKEIWA